MNIALVGFTNSYNDQRWLEMAGAWVGERDPGMAWASASRVAADDGCQRCHAAPTS